MFGTTNGTTKGCRPLTDDEVRRVVAGFGGADVHRNQALFVLGLRTGFRITELLSLRVGDVVDQGEIRPRITVRRRNMKKKIEGRTVPLHPDAKAALLAWIYELHRRGHAQVEAPLFRSRSVEPRAITRVQAYRIFKAAFDAAGVRGQTGTHSCRKTFAHHMWERLEHDLVKTARALGHRNITSTVSYLSFSEQDVDEAIMGSYAPRLAFPEAGGKLG